MVNETSIIKMGAQDDFHSLFYAQDLNGNFQAAHSDKTFFGNTDLQTSDAKAALNDLVAKLQAQGWQQVTVGVPSPWYSFEFKKVIS